MKFKDTLKRFLGRGLFHLGALTLAAVLTLSSPWAAHAPVLLLFFASTYFALILIFPMPEGSVRESRYAVPALSGLVTALILGAGLAVSPAAALFAGGSLSFVLRRIICRPSRAQDWLGLIPFTLGWLMWLPQFGVFTADFMILGAVTVIAAAALGVYRVARFLEERRRRSRDIEDARLKLKGFAADPEIPPEIRSALRDLPEDPSDGSLKFGSSAADALVNLVAALEPVKRHVDPATGRMLSKIEHEICAEGALKLAGTLAQELQSGFAREDSHDDPLVPFDKQCRRFETMERERGALPPELTRELGRIGRAGREIVRRIYLEPADYESGTAFLKRHLGFADHIVSELTRLSSQGQSEDLERVFRRSVEVLSRLSGVFEARARDLSRRDFEDFEAELKSFEAFMKMRGR